MHRALLALFRRIFPQQALGCSRAFGIGARRWKSELGCGFGASFILVAFVYFPFIHVLAPRSGCGRSTHSSRRTSQRVSSFPWTSLFFFWLCTGFAVFFCASSACICFLCFSFVTLADTGSMADPGSDNGRGLLVPPTPSDKLSVLWESLNLDFPEEVASHSELNRTIRNFGFLATSFDQLDQWLESHGLLDFGSGTHADLRCLWHRSHALACSEGHTAAVPFPPQSPALPLPQDQSFSSASDPSRTVSAAASWNEPFPAKLSSDKTAELRAAFLRKYPSEVLDDSTMPSARLVPRMALHPLALAHVSA